VRQRLRVLATGSATPDRLRRVGAVLAVGFLLTAVASLGSGLARTDAVRDDGARAAALAADAAELYRSLADADAMATSGYVSGGLEPAPVRARYDADVARAGDLIVHAAAQLAEGDPAAAPVATISEQLPVYSGLVETARAYNRQGLPLGQSYLDNASRLMRTTILPAAEELRRTQTAAFTGAFDRGGGAPLAVLLIGLGALAAVVDVSVRERRRTQRVLSVGLVAAGGAVVVALLWWFVATSVADARLAEAERHGAVAAALDDARSAVLQGRSNESLVLVARSGGSSSDQGFTAQLDRVLGTTDEPGLLTVATEAADPASDDRIAAVRAAAEQWMSAHRRVRLLDDGGRYREAVASATGAEPDGSGATFERLDAQLGEAVEAERAEFRAAAAGADAALTGLSVGPAALALLAAVAAVVGIGRRVGEYR
jgi:hypothetical protein